MNSMSEQILPTMFCGLTAKEIYSMKEQLANTQLENQKLRDGYNRSRSGVSIKYATELANKLLQDTPPNTDALKQYVDAEIARRIGEPVAWMLVTGHGTSLQLNKPDCELDYWKPLYTLKD
jgi:hypothetical protein